MTTSNDRPKSFVTPWAEAADKYKVEVPETKDEALAVHKARASMELGFPEITMKSAMRGGVPPWGTDHNGILYRITKNLQWIQAGGTAIFDRDLSNKIGGYPVGAMVQNEQDPTTLWFSIDNNNTFDPTDEVDPNDNNRKRENFWVKLDFADLEKRLKAVEDHLVVVDGRLDGHDKDIATNTSDIAKNTSNIATNTSDIAKNTSNIATNTSDIAANTESINYINNQSTNPQKEVKSFPDVYAKLGNKANQTDMVTAQSNISRLQSSKAEKEGGCGQPFHASTMSALKYDFGCPLGKDPKANSYITESAGLEVYTDTWFRGWVKNKGDTKDNFVFSFEPNYITLKTDLGIFLSVAADAGNVSTDTNVVMKNGRQFIHQNAKNNKAWYIDANDNDYIIGCYSDGYAPDISSTMATAIRISQADDNQHYNIHASGAFVNGDADLAEYYQADRQDYEPGTLMCHGVKTEVTLCKNTDQSNDFFGIISTRPGYIMNSNAETDPSYVLIALNGKVPVKVKGVVKCGDKITVGQDGYGIVSQNKNDMIVGRAKEDKITEEVGLVSCYVQAHI